MRRAASPRVRSRGAQGCRHNGLGVIRLLSITDQHRLAVDEAMEFVSLCAAVLCALSRIRSS